MTDVLLVCAIRAEWDALATLFESSSPGAVATDPSITGHIRVDAKRVSAALVEVGAGSTTASLSTLTAVQRYNPFLVIFAGVAGGVKDVQLADVVIASKVHYYEGGRSIKRSFLPRPESPPAPRKTVNIAKNLARTKEFGFQVLVGPLATGEKVIADSESVQARLIREAYSDTLAVEMEGAGFVKAMAHMNLEDYVIIRGISDLLDNKDATDKSGWQQRAARHATQTAAAFINSYFSDPSISVEPKPRPPHPQALLPPIELPFPPPSPSDVFVLLSEPNSAHGEAIVQSGWPLSLVLDLDTAPDRTGILSRAREQLSRDRVIHLGTPWRAVEPSRTSISWTCVRGLDEEEVAEVSLWKRRHWKTLRAYLEAFADVIGGRQVSLLIAAPNRRWRDWTILVANDLTAEFGENITTYVLGQPEFELDCDHLSTLSASELRRALDAALLDRRKPEDLTLPGSDGVVAIAASDAAWLREDLELVPIDAGAGGDAEASQLDFYRGGLIDWVALEHDADVLRSGYPTWRRQIEGILKHRRTLRSNLFHAPGAGGSTMARRSVFDLRTQYPAVIVDRVRPAETSRRVDFVARLTGLPVLCLLDSVRVTDSQVGDLVAEVQAASTSALILYVARRYMPPSAQSSSVFLEERLDDAEAADFLQTFSNKVPWKGPALTALAASPDQRRNAFFFGLTAFEEDFAGINNFVSGRLGALHEHQEKALTFCSIAHYYGQSGVPEYALAHLLGLPASKAGGLARLLSPEVRSLLWRSSDGNWRTSHQLIAREVLVQLGGGDYAWKRNLTRWGTEFAEFCLHGQPADQDLSRLAEGVFIERGSQDLLGTQSAGQSMFSRLLEDIPSQEGAVAMLAHAAGLVPQEPHFAAHVARYYAFKLRNYDLASEYAERATELAPDDDVLHHVLGMVHRSRVYDAMGRQGSLDEMAPWVREATKEFSEARRLSPSVKEHPYISEIQLRVRIIDYGVRRHGNIATYLASSPHPLVVESISVAEDLLTRVRYLGDARNPSGYERRSRGDLTALYGDYDRALQLFNSLLDNSRVDPLLVRRQIVWTHLARADRDWRKLSEKALQRIVGLLEENMHAGDYMASDARQWWRAVRYLRKPPSQDRIHEVLAYWRASEPSIESFYCSYVAYALDVMTGVRWVRPEMDKFQAECSSRARGDARRSLCFDWVGPGAGVSSLVHQSELGPWDPRVEFWSDASRLRRVEGRVAAVRGPQAGTADVDGIQAFFVPGRVGVERGRHENARVSGLLAFSNDGPRLWDVQLL